MTSGTVLGQARSGLPGTAWVVDDGSGVAAAAWPGHQTAPSSRTGPCPGQSSPAAGASPGSGRSRPRPGRLLQRLGVRAVARCSTMAKRACGALGNGRPGRDLVPSTPRWPGWRPKARARARMTCSDRAGQLVTVDDRPSARPLSGPASAARPRWGGGLGRVLLASSLDGPARRRRSRTWWAVLVCNQPPKMRRKIDHVQRGSRIGRGSGPRGGDRGPGRGVGVGGG